MNSSKSALCMMYRLGTLALCLAATCSLAAAESTPELVDRTSKQVAKFLDQFSDVKCTEQVTQEKFKADGKVELKADSTFDYLVILTNTGGDLTLNESRLPVHESKVERKNVPLLISNGFATLFLVFHPYYASAFDFKDAGNLVVDGRTLQKIQFHHISGMRSPAALALRGREFPLELAGTAWIEPKSAMIARIEAGVDQNLEDIGMKSLHSEIDFSPVAFHEQQAYWFPSRAIVEVETPRQHWRNTHRFTDYKQFSVSTEEQVAPK
jgi:hypothetical protein